MSIKARLELLKNSNQINDEAFILVMQTIGHIREVYSLNLDSDHGNNILFLTHYAKFLQRALDGSQEQSIIPNLLQDIPIRIRDSSKEIINSVSKNVLKKIAVTKAEEEYLQLYMGLILQ